MQPVKLGLVLVRTLEEEWEFFLAKRIALFLDVEAEKSCEQQPMFVVHRTVAALIHESRQSVNQRSNLKARQPDVDKYERAIDKTLCQLRHRPLHLPGSSIRCQWSEEAVHVECESLNVDGPHASQCLKNRLKKRMSYRKYKRYRHTQRIRQRLGNIGSREESRIGGSR